MESVKSRVIKQALIEQLRQRMTSYQPRHLPLAAVLPEAAVLMPITLASDPEFILTMRPKTMPTHAGEVAFPGGRHEKGETIRDTAFREAHEEVGLVPEAIELLGQLSPLASSHGMKVTPYVGLVAADFPLVADSREVDEIFRVPIQFFLDTPPQLTQPIKILGHHFRLPNYYYGDKRIWGLSAMMIIELLNHAYDAGISLK